MWERSVSAGGGETAYVKNESVRKRYVGIKPILTSVKHMQEYALHVTVIAGACDEVRLKHVKDITNMRFEAMSK